MEGGFAYVLLKSPITHATKSQLAILGVTFLRKAPPWSAAACSSPVTSEDLLGFSYGLGP